MRFLTTCALLFLPLQGFAQENLPSVSDVLADHILPGFQSLATTTDQLADAAQEDCSAQSTALREAYGAAFDAWISVSHLRFGPTEVGDRAFALAFWPDSRGVTPRSLATLIADQDSVVLTPEAFSEVSIAARGFYALEFLLFDSTLSVAGEAQYRCQLVQTLTQGMADLSGEILHDWQNGFGAQLVTPDPEGLYQTEDEARKELFKALSTGLQFTADTRLGRPLGTFDRPRPKRAEAWRSERSARHVSRSLTALQDLAQSLSVGDAALGQELDHAFEVALKQLADLNDPTFASVSEPQTRLQVEVLQQSIQRISGIVGEKLGPRLGVAAGFNSLDGD